MNRVLGYLVLLGSSVVIGLLLTILFIMIFEDRGTGISWGICSGLFIGSFLTSYIFQKNKIFISIAKTLIYSGFVFVLFYTISNYLDFQYDKILYLISIILAWESSGQILKG